MSAPARSGRRWWPTRSTTCSRSPSRSPHSGHFLVDVASSGSFRHNPAVVNRGVGIRSCLLAVIAGALLAVPAVAHGATGITVDANAPKQADLLDKLQIKGSLTNPVPGDVVNVTVTAS